MLFNSYSFIFVYLPVVLLGYLWLRRFNRMSVAWLASASLMFYALANWRYLPVLLCSIGFNFFTARLLISDIRKSRRRTILGIGVGSNLAALVYYKYAFALSEAINPGFLGLEPLLPVGISFYTFTQIACLVDVYRKQGVRYPLTFYALFVAYFPHLIAGPILHHRDVIPQFTQRETTYPPRHLIAYGLMIFSVGLFKKSWLADGIQPFVGLAFENAAPSFDQAWIGALAYAFQLYFDFSGYSDMAVGLSLMFGIFLPVNFNSPYRASNIIAFWQRWHMTLAHFLRDYLYIPLGGSRRGAARRYLNLMITMLLGGLWHGAGWTFLAWGALHGLYLCTCHAWQRCGAKVSAGVRPVTSVIAFVLTFVSVVIAWIPFRAKSLSASLMILSRMTDWSEIVWSPREALALGLSPP